MSKAIITEQHLTDIADAIRAVNGETTTYTPPEMAEAILSFDYVTRTEFEQRLATKSGFEVATHQRDGLMSKEDKITLDNLSVGNSTQISLSGETSPLTIDDASGGSVVGLVVDLPVQIESHPGKNLLNPDLNISGYWIGANGKPTAQEGDWYTSLIPVETGDRIYVSGYHNQTTNGNKRLHGYDERGVWVTQLNFASVPANAYPPAVKYSFNATIPSSVKFMRFSYRVADTEVMIEKDQETHYEPYGEEYTFTAHTTPLTISHETSASTTNYSLAITSPIYVGEVNALTGEVKKTYDYISSYNGEQLPGVWYSTHSNNYTQGTTPSIGDEVVYEMTTPDVSMVSAISPTLASQYNKITLNDGEFKEFTYDAVGTSVQNIKIDSGVMTLGNTTLTEQQLNQLLQLLS